MHSTIYWKLGSLVQGMSYIITIVIEMSSFVQVCNPRYGRCYYVDLWFNIIMCRSVLVFIKGGVYNFTKISIKNKATITNQDKTG